MTPKLIVDFEEQMNDIVAPITRAWTNYTIEQIRVDGTLIGDDEARFTVVVKANRRKVSPHPRELSMKEALRQLVRQTVDLRDGLKQFIEYVEEQNVLIAEVFLAHGYDPVILDELCEKESGRKLREFVQMYEHLCREARKKWELPK